LDSAPFSPAEGGLRIAVRLTPKASRTGVAGLRRASGGAPQIAVKVTAAPERGKANAAMLDLLSRSWGIPVSRLSVVGGATDRNKLVFVQGEPEELWRRLQAWLGEVAG
jgi:uncharacterized protein YggU (UPF0235/DUF167 family)